ncbi:MAG: low temperature requirement protein A [Alphaproteobacteria bacterium]
MLSARTSQLRVRRGHEHHRVTFVELFFDLVFVFAITQLSHGLLAHLTPLGVLQTAILMLAVWWAWIDNAWITNWLDPERAPVRLLLFLLMLLGLFVSAAIPKAFDERAAAFALAYGALEITPKLFMLWALKRHDRGNYRNFLRISVWRVLGAACWVAGGFVPAEARLPVWTLALAIDTASPILGFWVPGLGRSTTADWTVEGAHMAERCGLFVIIALGESILITGATFAELTWDAVTLAAFANGFIGSTAMWAVYFNIGAERSSRAVAASDDPGRLARSGYTYMHIPIVAGIIVAAVADELTLHHPGGHTDIKTAAVILGGPALYLAGNLMFKWLTAPHPPLSHMVGLGLLAALSVAVPFAPPLALATATTAVLILVAVWEWLSLGRRSGSKLPV